MVLFALHTYLFSININAPFAGYDSTKDKSTQLFVPLAHISTHHQLNFT